MFDWGSSGGGFMTNALGGGNNLQRWAGAVQQPFTGLPTQTFWQPPAAPAGAQPQPKQIQPRPQWFAAPPASAGNGDAAPPAPSPMASQPQPTPQPQASGPFMAGNIMGPSQSQASSLGTGDVDPLQKNKLAPSAQSAGFMSRTAY